MIDVLLLLLAIAAIYGSFLVAGALHKRSKRTWATFSPVFVFLPIALLCLGQVRSITPVDAGVLLGFSLLLSLVIWLHQRRS